MAALRKVLLQPTNARTPIMTAASGTMCDESHNHANNKARVSNLGFVLHSLELHCLLAQYHSV